ncbi:MAG TPA: endonuclease/exonuclease/phosphatase family protein [Longimicrobiaceae bacterium]|nr:endonuclease/exonuclease/phosphatase family protein [Longimicrobiaceae bacterium]
MEPHVTGAERLSLRPVFLPRKRRLETATHPARVSLKGLLSATLLVCGVGLWFVTLLGFAGAAWWLLDLFSHFRVQYLVLATVAALLLLWMRNRRAAAAMAVCAAVNLAVVLPYLAPTALFRASTSRSGVVRVATANVHTANRDHGAVARFLSGSRADFVVLLEVDDAWLSGLSGLRREFPYGVHEARDDNFGIALLSRHPCVQCRIVRLGEAGVPSVMGEFEVRGSRFTLVGTHPLPPVGAEYARLNAEQVRSVAAYMADLRGPKVLVGDLNMTPWSAHFQPLLRRAGLRDSGAGRGVGWTWPTHAPLLGIPIDHVLTSPGVHVVERKRGPDVGSDHLPVLVSFVP